MTARIIDGKARAARLTDDVGAAVAARVAAGRTQPGLAVVLVGENPASQVYVRNKRRTTEAAGMRSFAYDLPGATPEADLLALIDTLNADPRRARHPGAAAAAEAHRRGAVTERSIPARTSTAFTRTTSADWC